MKQFILGLSIGITLWGFVACGVPDHSHEGVGCTNDKQCGELLCVERKCASRTSLDAGVSQSAPSPYASGRRIKAKFIVGEDGTRQFAGWYDSKLKADCSWQTASSISRQGIDSDNYFCLAREEVQFHQVTPSSSQLFSDSTCENSLVLLDCSTRSKYFFITRFETNPAYKHCTSGENVPRNIYRCRAARLFPGIQTVYRKTGNGKCEKMEDSFLEGQKKSGRQFLVETPDKCTEASLSTLAKASIKMDQ